MFTPFNRLRVYAPHDDEEVTKQSSKDECDIYQILKQYQRTGVLTHIAAQQPSYQDLPSEIDYQMAANLVLAADESFSTLPASVRDEFNNDPAAFLAAFESEPGIARLKALGVIETPPAPLPTPDTPNPA